MAFGKSILNKRLRCTKHRIIKTQAVFEKYCGDPFLQRVIDVAKDYSIFISTSEDIILDQPLHVGFQILENSKQQMYNLFHNVIKKSYGENVKLLYSDTDSLILGFTGVDDIYHEFKSGALAPHMDLSNYKPESPFYDRSRKGCFGFLKDEMGGKIITEAICLLPKSYSLLTEDPVNGIEHIIAAKGVPFNAQRRIKHKTYQDLLDGRIKQVFVKCSNIRSKNFNLYTTHTKKVGLSNIDIKRFYLDKTKSVAYGHPLTIAKSKRSREDDNNTMSNSSKKKSRVL